MQKLGQKIYGETEILSTHISSVGNLPPVCLKTAASCPSMFQSTTLLHVPIRRDCISNSKMSKLFYGLMCFHQISVSDSHWHKNARKVKATVTTMCAKFCLMWYPNYNARKRWSRWLFAGCHCRFTLWVFL